MSNKNEIYLCDCGCEGIIIEFDEEFPEVFLSFWNRGLKPSNPSLYTKLRWIWHIIKDGSPWNDSIALNLEHCIEFGNKLIEYGNKIKEKNKNEN